MNPKHLILNFLTLIVLGECSTNPDELYRTCNDSFICGTVSGFRFPFRRESDPAHCGYPGFELNCNEQNPPTITIKNMTFRVLGIDPTVQILKIVREDMIESICPQDLVNTTMDHNLFDYTSSYINTSFFFGCPVSWTGVGFGSVVCNNNGGNPVFFLPGVHGPIDCQTSVVVPVPVGFLDPNSMVRVVGNGFEVRWTVEDGVCTGCKQSGGRCVYNNDTRLTACGCPEPPFLADSCTGTNKTRVGSSPPSRSSRKGPVIIILPTLGAILVVAGIAFGIFVCKQRRKRRNIKEVSSMKTESRGLSSNTQSNFSSSIPSYPSSKTTKDFTKCSYFGAQVFTYEELELATDNFNDSRELGDGGFGTVYHGKLLDGREVAVKRLYDNNFKRVHQFMNEVEILTRLQHENLVKLYGCTSKQSRELLLVYEYIPNGTVGDHLHGKLSNSNSNLFPWSIRLNIAIETAEALTYLHENDIIHRDVKTNNILLDKSFKVKVADFGLSRLFPNNATHVSTAPQGTPGYVDPEYYLCYQLTDKSDVFSFGVVLIELISSLQAVDTNRDRLDINLAAMGVNKIQNHMLEELVDKRIGFESDGVVRRTVALVAELAFRCLQPEADMRPTMKEVVEILRGIRNDEMNVQKPEVVDVVVERGLFKDRDMESPSPDYGVTKKLVDGSMLNSSDGGLEFLAFNRL